MDNETTTSESQAIPQNKAELMARIKQAWVTLEQTVGQLSNDQLTGPRDDSGWSVKDHLAHVTAWEQSLLALLEVRNRDAAVGLDVAHDEGMDVDDVNAIIFQRNRDRSLRDVLAALRQSHAQVLAALARLTDADLFKPYSHYQPDDQPLNATPVIGWIIGNTYEHYLEHDTWIRVLTAAHQ
jgi:hypothetical protein